MRIVFIVAALVGALIFLSPQSSDLSPFSVLSTQSAQAQGQGRGQDAVESPVGVIPEGETEAEPSRSELRLVGGDCDINEAEASLLRTKGVVVVDVESKPGSLVVDYDPNAVKPQQMVDAVAKRMDGSDTIGIRMGGEKAKKRGCRAHVIK